MFPVTAERYDLLAQVMQYVHRSHAGARVGDVGRELVAREASHMQVSEAPFERVADLDARLADGGIDQDQDASGGHFLPDSTLAEYALGLDFDRPGLVERDDADVDAKVFGESIRHAPESRAERRQDPGGVVNARVWRRRGSRGHGRRARRRRTGILARELQLRGRCGDQDEEREKDRRATAQASPPPSIGIAAPLIWAAACEARNATRAATSSGAVTRPLRESALASRSAFFASAPRVAPLR